MTNPSSKGDRRSYLGERFSGLIQPATPYGRHQQSSFFRPTSVGGVNVPAVSQSSEKGSVRVPVLDQLVGGVFPSLYASNPNNSFHDDHPSRQNTQTQSQPEMVDPFRKLEWCLHCEKLTVHVYRPMRPVTCTCCNKTLGRRTDGYGLIQLSDISEPNEVYASFFSLSSSLFGILLYVSSFKLLHY